MGRNASRRRPQGVLVSQLAAPDYAVNDPVHARAGSEWMRGVTPLRFTALVAVCIMFGARPSLWNLDPANLIAGLERLLTSSMRYFVCALPLFFLIVKADLWTVQSSLRVRIAVLAFVVVFGALTVPAGIASLRTLDTNYDPQKPQAWQSWHFMLAFYVRGLSTGALLAAILLFAAREREAQRRIHRVRLALVEIDKQAAELRLRLLQAQIEPHFLFNSLASVKRLYEREAGKGRALLRNLIDYLRVATGRARQRDATLGEEVALARSFLAIFQVRMGTRLRMHFDVPANLEAALVPPLMLGTLVENAIKHGIAPRASGGSLGISASSHEGRLAIAVVDDGVGFRSRSGPGVGLANTRARLETQFARAGVLELTANAEGGVTATIRLPLRLSP